MYMGTKGTLILKREIEAYLFTEGEAATTRVEVSPQGSGPVADASASRPADAQGRTINPSGGAPTDRELAYRNEIAEFCAAVRTGTPVRCGPEKAMKSAVACLTANRAAEQKTRLELHANA